MSIRAPRLGTSTVAGGLPVSWVGGVGPSAGQVDIPRVPTPWPWGLERALNLFG